MTASGLEIACRTDAGSRLDKGSPVHLAVKPERIHLFDPESGAALPLPADAAPEDLTTHSEREEAL